MDVKSSRRSSASVAASAQADLPRTSATGGMDTGARGKTASQAGTAGSAPQARNQNSGVDVETLKLMKRAARKLRTGGRVPLYQKKMAPPHLNQGWTTAFPLPEKQRERRRNRGRHNHPLTPPEPCRAEGTGASEDLHGLIRALRAEVASLREEIRLIGSQRSSPKDGLSGWGSPCRRRSRSRNERSGSTPMPSCESIAQSASMCEEAMETDPQAPTEPMEVEPSRETLEAAPRVDEGRAPLATGEGPTDPQPEGAVGGAADPEDVERGHDYYKLLMEFDEWIHMKSTLMKRDQQFIKMLPGLMQRWLRSKKIEETPQVFVDGLTRACISCVMPSEAELSLTRLLGTPDTRVAIERLNKAIGGEVTVFEDEDVEAWIQDQMWRFPVWWFTWWFGYFPATHFKLWVPNLSFLGLFSALYWLYPSVAQAFGFWDDICVDLPLPNLKWRYGGLPWWEGTMSYHEGDLFVVHVFCMLQLAQMAARFMMYYCWFTNFLRGYYRFMYYWSDWVPKGMWRDPMGGVRCFGAGNGKSQ